MCGPYVVFLRTTVSDYSREREMILTLLVYGDVLKRVCQTVTASSSTSSEMTLTVSLYLKSS